jgi:hypothetical protein
MARVLLAVAVALMMVSASSAFRVINLNNGGISGEEVSRAPFGLLWTSFHYRFMAASIINRLSIYLQTRPFFLPPPVLAFRHCFLSSNFALPPWVWVFLPLVTSLPDAYRLLPTLLAAQETFVPGGVYRTIAPCNQGSLIGRLELIFLQFPEVAVKAKGVLHDLKYVEHGTHLDSVSTYS